MKKVSEYYQEISQSQTTDQTYGTVRKRHRTSYMRSATGLSVGIYTIFLAYINDLLDSIRSKVMLFANDTAVFLSVSNQEDAKVLQQDMDRLDELSLKLDIELNSSKCIIIHAAHVIEQKHCFNLYFALCHHLILTF